MMGNETLLPKNIRQIGEIPGKRKICLEDYVMTYIRKTANRKEGNFLGVFLGEHKTDRDVEYVFARGILEVRDLSRDKENASTSEITQKNAGQSEEEHTKRQKVKDVSESTSEVSNDDRAKASDPWERLRREQEMYFPGCEILGCCVIGRYPAGRLEELYAHLPGAKRFLYHLQDQEERLYWLEGEKYEGIQGYFVFYEQNRRMQEYLADVFGEESVDHEGPADKAIVRFREKVKSKAEEKSKSFLKLASSFFVVGVLLVGVLAVNRVEDMRDAQNSADGVAVVNRITESAESDSDTESMAVINSENTLAGADAFWSDDTEEGERIEPDTGDLGETESTGEAAESEASAAGAVASNGAATEENATSAVAATGESLSDAAAGDADGSDTAVSGTEETEAASSRQVQASYVIREGDTLAEICTKYYGSLDFLEELCEANGIEDANLIHSGQKIVLP